MTSKYPVSRIVSIIVAIVSLLSAPTLMAAAGDRARNAIHDGNIDKLRKALDAGASPDFVSKSTSTAMPYSLLGYALMRGRDDMAALLIERGANPSIGINPTFLYTLSTLSPERAAIVSRFLLDKGADPNLRWEEHGSSYTPLHAMCYAPTATQVFLEKGARVDELAYHANRTIAVTPLSTCGRPLSAYLDAVSKAGTDQGSKYLQERHARLQNTLLALINANANVNIKLLDENDKQTPILLRVIASAGSHRLIQAFVDHGADVLATQEPTGATTLYAATQVQDADLARWLIVKAKEAIQSRTANQQEADQLFHAWLDRPAMGGRTALHSAAALLDTKTIQALIENGADYAIRDSQGNTAQDIVAIVTEQRIVDKATALADAQEAQRLRAERANQAARESAANKQMLLGIAGAMAITSATSSSNFSDAQRSQLVDGYLQDRVNAINGQTTDGFSQAASNVNGQLDMARMAAAHQATVQREQRVLQE
ncbi:MAG TPA: hypothetical protein VK629_14405, partial [Steroidobacteraceae bacterium]|nr:hypothetical protein [Steroidobacteraceae bacterium]